MIVKDILKLVSSALQDIQVDTDKRWSWENTGDETVSLLDFFNFAVNTIVTVRPDATAKTEVLALECGNVQQSLPKDCYTLLDITRNMGADGYTPSRAISITPIEMVTRLGQYADMSGTILHYAYDRITNPNAFWVYPTPWYKSDVYIEAVYSSLPTKVCSENDCIPIKGTYSEAIFHHILASILSGDSDVSNMQKANYHAQMLNTILGTKSQVDTTWPKTRVTA